MAKRAHLWLFVMAVGCHQNSVMMTGDDAANSDSADAYHSGPCWPIDSATPGGTVELGTGYPTFVTMPDQIELEYGPQGGFDIPARVRMQGLDPGSSDPLDVTNPINPHTRILSYFVDTGVPNTTGPCGLTIPYMPDPDVSGGYILMPEIMVEWDTSLLAADLFNKQFRVVVEIIDSNGLYAMDQKVVTALAPPNWFQDAGP